MQVVVHESWVTESFVVLSSLLQKFTNPVPELEPLFDSPDAQEVLQRTIALHFLRTGQFNIAETFLNVRVSCYAANINHI